MKQIVLKKYSRTNIKLCLFANRYTLWYFNPDTKTPEKLYGTYNRKQALKAWHLLRILFMYANHLSCWKEKKELLNDNHSLYKGYYEVYK